MLPVRRYLYSTCSSSVSVCGVLKQMKIAQHKRRIAVRVANASNVCTSCDNVLGSVRLNLRISPGWLTYDGSLVLAFAEGI